MGRKLVDLTGQRFGRLVCVEHLGREHHSSMWRCLCDCGESIKAQATALKSGARLSCGCYRRERMGTLMRKHGERGGAARAKTSPEYKAWDSMKARCYNPTDKAWKWYGARGIGVCDRWRSDFAAFLADMGRRPGPAYSIERKDGAKDYCPDNCAWATATEQARNRSNNRRVFFCGAEMTLAAAAALAGLPYKTVKSRLGKGWSLDDALSEPVDPARVERATRGDSPSLPCAG